jgi:myosin heavy subunit
MYVPAVSLQEGEIVAKLLDLDSDDLYRNLLKPKIKVGSEFVTQGRTKDQVSWPEINTIKMRRFVRY